MPHERMRSGKVPTARALFRRCGALRSWRLMTQDLPHHYRIAATAGPEGDVNLAGAELDPIRSAPPAEYGGPGDRWSPETLLVAAVADCFVLSFRAISRASKLSWLSLNCDVEGTLARIEDTTKFTEFRINATLDVLKGTNEQRAHRILEKAEASCLITNSLSGTTHLSTEVMVKPWRAKGADKRGQGRGKRSQRRNVSQAQLWPREISSLTPFTSNN